MTDAVVEDTKVDIMNDAEAVLVRSAAMHDMEFGENVKVIARAGAGVNNIPLTKCADHGIVVFNTPGANANAVKELVVAGMFLASRDIIGGANWVQSERMNEDIAKLTEKEKKYIRFEVFSSGRKAEDEPKEYNITVINRGDEAVIKASSSETVLCAFERAGIEVPARCHTGECGFCRSKLVSGKVYIPEGEDKRRVADMQFDFIHPCCCYPESDLVVRIN